VKRNTITPTIIIGLSAAFANKMDETLSRTVANPKCSGVYGITGTTREFERSARAAGLSIIKLDLGRLRGKAGLLNVLAKALKFPKHFGQNWDALHDFLTDLEWFDAKGWLVVVANGKSFAGRHGEHFATAIQVLRAAAEHWRGQGKPFWVLVESTKNWSAGLPEPPTSHS